MTSIDDIAGNRATDRTLLEPNVASVTPDNLTTGDDLLKSFREAFTTTSSGKSFKIQSVSSGDFFIAIGSPLIKELTDAGVVLTDKKQVSKFIQDMPVEKQMELGLSEDHIMRMRRIVCEGVTSLVFTMKRQGEITESGVYSVHLLSVSEVSEVFSAISQISVPEGDVDATSNFREGASNRNGKEQHSTSDTDSRQVDGETIQLTLSEKVSANEANDR